MVAGDHVPAVQQRRPVDVRLVRHAELDEPGAAVALHGPAVLGSAVPDLAAAGRLPSFPHGRIAAASLAQVVQVNDVAATCPARSRNTIVANVFFFSFVSFFSFTSSPPKKCNIFNFCFCSNTFVVYL